MQSAATMETGPGIKPVDNETISRASRTTKEGKKYTYRMTVLQQPIRARACGAGAKSSADRRPVDPPPIVELKIFDESDRDVTFSMNANYFLFTTLEQARNIHNARGMPQDRGTTVLTGTPVAGMVCLDRPEPAGYFIFPDLSVRHEGQYRLSFSLFEELKDPKDEDQVDDVSKQSGMGDIQHVTNRLEVKSLPFTVYSAKKFPGLTESTSLSRMVAEQGCRVRIRRDVRMRKRETKGGKEWEGYEDQTAEHRARMSATPETYSALQTPHGYMDSVPRPRSGSNASHHSLAPSLPLSRRPSLQEMGQGYHATTYNTGPHTPQSAYPQTSPFGPSPSQPYSQAPFAQHQPAMQPPPPQYPQQSYQPPPTQPGQQGYYGHATGSSLPATMVHNAYTHHPPPQSATYESHDYTHRPSINYMPQSSHDHRRSSEYTAPPPAAMPQTYSRHESFQAPNTQPAYQSGPLPPQSAVYTQPPQQSSAGAMNGYGQRPAPLEPVQPPTRTTGATTPFRTTFPNQLPPLNTLNVTSKPLEPSSPASGIPPAGMYNTSVQSQLDSHKRGYGQVFNDRHLSQPLRHGARPSSPGQSFYTTEVDDNEPEPTSMGGPEFMNYRRSDGRHMQRPLQPQN